MLWAVIFSIVALTIPPALVASSAQVALVSGPFWEDAPYPVFPDDGNPAKWSLNQIPNPNSTDHLVFETVYSLLQYWPNGRMGNGHNIVPGNVPEGTLLYHCTSRKKLPPGPEWAASDPEYSYRYCRGKHGCWQLTLVATRPLKVVYFDGASGAKRPDGPMDTQDLLAWGESRPTDSWNEAKRIEDLCAWGRDFAVDGFVRMGVGFEVMLCDFTSGLSVMSFANLITEYGLPSDVSRRVLFEALHASAWHDRFPGETRIQLDLSGLVSFYDTQLAPSLIAVRAGQQRQYHRVRDVSKEDLSAVVSKLGASLIGQCGPSSSIDWRTLVQVVVDRYAGRLELMRHLLNSTVENPTEILDHARKTQTQLRIMLAPYLVLSAVPTDASDEDALDWTAPIYKACSTTSTNYLQSKQHSMTDSEKLILRAVRETSREICRILTKMWAAGVYAGIDPSLNTKEIGISQLARTWNTWREDLNGLTEWLDWSVWVKCDPGCGVMEICFLHGWPLDIPSAPASLTMGTESFTKQVSKAGIGSLSQPSCISLVDP